MAMSSEDSSISLADVLAVAALHPFYNSSVQYPPGNAEICTAQERAKTIEDTASLLLQQPLLQKSTLYTTISRLVNDTSPQNTFRRNVYVSITGGGFGSKPLFFATDTLENRRHRAAFGQFLRSTGLSKDGDWVLSTHCAGELYRSLDLTLELWENSGASILSAGQHMAPMEVVKMIVLYNINALTGDGSQIVGIVSCIAQLPQEERDAVKLDKVIYTSEVLTASQRQLIYRTLGQEVKIYSVLGSAEAGPWAVSNPDISGGPSNASTSITDFIYDKRAMHLEVISLSSSLESSLEAPPPIPIPEGEQGIIIQTSLSRLRNPLVRYNTGDVGSLHPVPEHARSLIPAEDWPYLGLVRLHGRDTRFSFDWDGEYMVFSDFAALLNQPAWGIVQWQIILDKMEPSLESSLEIRVLCGGLRDQHAVREEEVEKGVRTFCHVYAANEHRFRMSFLSDMEGFERSKTGRKVIKFVDRYNVD